MPKFSLRALFALVAGVGILVMLGSWILQSGALRTRTPDPRNTCTNNLRQLAVALQNYHDVFKRFPPAYVPDANGKPMHSWRVCLLPFLEENIAYLQYDFKQPWDSPHNLKVIETVDPYSFRCPSATGGDPHETNYVAVVGPETAWPGAKQTKLHDIHDGPEQTILLIEVANSGIHWAEPRDWPIEWALQGVNPPHSKGGISSGHRDGANVVMCDGRVEFLPNDTPTDQLRAVLTIAGGEDVADVDQRPWRYDDLPRGKVIIKRPLQK